jgi:hypothetical protein
MNWTTADGLKAQLRRRWERGELLRCLVDGQSLFPLRLTLKGPNTTELAECFDAVRTWIAALVAVPQIRIEWRDVNHRIVGQQRVPQSAWVDHPDDAFALIGKRQAAARFSELQTLTRSRQPGLLTWLAKHPLRAIELAEDWERLLAVVDWLVRHPRPGIYLRQADIPGIHSKYIEMHRGVLVEWFDLVLLPQNIESDRIGASQFASRYGFLDKPVRIRFRMLDPSVALLPGPRLPDIALDADSFASLAVPICRVFITENETNFLAFPLMRNSIVVFGAGYGWDALAKADWLKRCTIYYWGDIDTHGFAILDQLRARFDHVESFLMDRATLMTHKTLWGKEDDQVLHDLSRLTSAEQALFDELRDNRIRKGLRLEQERVGFRWVQDAVASMTRNAV